MAYELYWISGSPYAWRALLGLTIKGVEYDSKIVEASKGEHKEPWFLEMNPRGKVPVLRDGDTVIYESLAILTYLEAKHPEPALFGTAPAETGRIWRKISELESYLSPPVTALIMPVLFGGLDEKIGQVREAAGQVHTELEGIERELGASPFLAGDEVSAADAVLFPMVQIVLRAMAKEEAKPLELGFLPFDGRYPHHAAWMKRIEALPGYDKTTPPHWRQAPPS